MISVRLGQARNGHLCGKKLFKSSCRDTRTYTCVCVYHNIGQVRNEKVKTAKEYQQQH